jgi:Fur family peroxide stress response transcriptional regulator
MTVETQELEQRLHRCKEDLKQAGIRLTHQRLEIFKEVAKSEDHPDAETVYQEISNRLPTVSLDTVYRTLHLLSDLGLIDTLGTPTRGVRFDANTVSHHHFICTRCGTMRDFYSDKLDRLRLPDSVRSLGQPLKAQVEVKGICRQCIAQGKPGAKKKKKRR